MVDVECDSDGEPLEASDSDSDDSSDDDDESGSENAARLSSLTSGTRKRLQPRYAICEEFDTTNMGKYDCRWHSGRSLLDPLLAHSCIIDLHAEFALTLVLDSREPDYESDIWADHGEGCHGPIEDYEDEEPEGFIWRCCDRQGDQ